MKHQIKSSSLSPIVTKNHFYQNSSTCKNTLQMLTNFVDTEHEFSNTMPPGTTLESSSPQSAFMSKKAYELQK